MTNKAIRNAAVLTLIAGLMTGIAGCGVGDVSSTPDAVKITPSTPLGLPVMKPTAPTGTQKADTYSASFVPPQSVPEEWRGGAGWSADNVNQVVAMRNHIAYSTKTPDSANPHKLLSGFRIYDNNGVRLVDIGEPKELDGASSQHKIVTTWRSGKMFTSFMQVGRVKGEGDRDGLSTVVTSFDEDANQLSRVIIDGTPAPTPLGLIEFTVWDAKTGGPMKSVNLDPLTGSVTPSTTVNAEGITRLYNGVEVKVVLSPTTGRMELSNDGWEKDQAGRDDDLGRYISLGLGAGHCEVLDPNTGKLLSGSEKGCKIWEQTIPGSHVPLTYTDALILGKQDGYMSKNMQYVLFLPSKENSYLVPEGNQFIPVGVGPDGTFYGYEDETRTKVMSINPATDDSLKALDGVQRPPVAVAGNGIAAFSATGGEGSGQRDSLFFMIPKK